MFWALGSMLGLNLILLLSWAASLLFAGEHSASLGRLAVLSEKLAVAPRPLVAPAQCLFVATAQLNRWALGTLVNGLWLLAMLSALVMMLLLMATPLAIWNHNSWESTVLFVATRALNALQLAGHERAHRGDDHMFVTANLYNNNLVHVRRERLAGKCSADLRRDRACCWQPCACGAGKSSAAALQRWTSITCRTLQPVAPTSDAQQRRLSVMTWPRAIAQRAGRSTATCKPMGP